MLIREQKHRLDRSLYTGQVICAFTLCIHEQKALFISETLFRAIEKILLESLHKTNCRAHVYLFMPNHLHLLVEGLSTSSDLWKMIVNFKQKSGYWLSKNSYRGRWQKNFYDHVPREDEDILKQVKYILDNPGRKELTKNWKDYHFKGSTIYNFSKLDL